MTAPLSPTRYLGPAFQLIHGPVVVASAMAVDPFVLDETWAAQAAFHEVTGPSTPASARVVVPLYPPVAWLTDEAADMAPAHLTIYPTGRVAGIVAPDGRCLLDGSTRGECWTVPRPADGRGSTLIGGPGEEYQMARGAGVMHLADGTVIAAAPLPGEGGHANAWATPENAADHYANTANQVARGRYVWSDTAGNGVGGIVFVGALVPTITEPRLIVARGSASSIDFRWIDDEDRYRLVGCCNVNIGGLPSKYRAAVMAGSSFLLPIGPSSCGCSFDGDYDPCDVVSAINYDDGSIESHFTGCHLAALDADSDPQLQEDPAMGTTTAPCSCGATTTITDREGAERHLHVPGYQQPDDLDATFGELADVMDPKAAALGDATAAPMDPEVSARLDAIEGTQAEILRLVADIHGALVTEAVSDLPAR